MVFSKYRRYNKWRMYAKIATVACRRWMKNVKNVSRTLAHGCAFAVMTNITADPISCARRVPTHSRLWMACRLTNSRRWSEPFLIFYIKNVTTAGPSWCVCWYERTICVPYNLCTECLIAFKVENTVDLVKKWNDFLKIVYRRWRLDVKTATAMPLLEAIRVNHATHIS